MSAEPDRDRPRLCVFAPWPIFTVTIERSAQGDNHVYFHAGGQGVWIARMAAILGAEVTLCGPFGGETGLICRRMIEAEAILVRAVEVASWNGGYVADRREGERRQIADMPSPRLTRHEIDDLYDAALAEGLGAGAVAISDQRGEEVMPADTIARLARDLHANGVTVVADVGGPTLKALSGGVSTLKVSHEELVDAGFSADDGEPALIEGMLRLAEGAAENIVVSRADKGALALLDGALYETVTPELTPFDHTGAGDSMSAALAVARASGLDADETLRLASAAGALNVTRHGRGTGSRRDIEELGRRVEVRRKEA